MMLAFIAQASSADLAKILQNKEGPDKFQIIHVADLVKLQADPNSHVQVFDANHPSTRERFGIIPGAHLLSSDDKYDVAAELPKDKSAKLVFYCADFK
jgi:rhodanese-related sulfurtransferase